MRWDDVIPAIVAAVVADSTIQATFGGTDPNVFLEGEREYVVGSMVYRIETGGELEVWEGCRIEFDYWVRSFSELTAVEAVLRALLHGETAITIGSVTFYGQLDPSGQEMEGAAEGTFMRTLGFELEFLRGRHTQ